MAQRRRLSLSSCLLVLVIACLVIALIGVGYVGLASLRPRPTLPIITITEPATGAQVTRNDSVIVFARAQDVAGIARVEFFVNGQLVGAQVNNIPQANVPFTASQVWRPTAPGAYTILARAINPQGFAGESSLVLIEAIEKTRDPNAIAQTIVQPGDTVDSIAKESGVTPQDVVARNPNLATHNPTPGDSLTIPVPPDAGPSDDAPSAGAPDIPPISPPGEPPAVPPDGGDAYVPPFWDGIGRLCFVFPSLCSDRVPRRPECIFNPRWCMRLPGDGGGWVPDLGDFGDALRGMCESLPGLPGCVGSPEPGGRAPTAPRSVAASLLDCSVWVRWSDDADNELGYRVYRQPARGAFQLIALVAPGGRIAADANLPPGAYRYFIAAFNSAGSNVGGVTASVTVPDACRRLARVDETVEFEALEMNVRESFDRLYCYVSLAGQPYERVPYSPRDFLRLDAGRTNIAEHLSGRNKVILRVARAIPVEVEAQCLGWRGRELINLGSFRRSHPAPEWDGRRLTADAGGFSVAYHIRPRVRERADEEIGAPNLASPSNVRTATEWHECMVISPDLYWDTRHAETGIQWDWSFASQAGTYRVYRRLPDESEPSLYFTGEAPCRSAPLWRAAGTAWECTPRVYYSVIGVLAERDPGTGDEVVSSRSSELEVASVGGCPAFVQVRLDTLRAGTLDDGCAGFICSSTDRTVEAYGKINVNGLKFTWNLYDPECPGGFGSGCVLPAVPETTSIRSNRDYNWATMWLATSREDGSAVSIGSWHSRSYQQNNNFVVLAQFTNEPIEISVRFKDHDTSSGNDQWCAGSRIVAGRSIEDWARANETIEIAGSAADGSCTVRVTIQGLGLAAP